MSNPCPHKTLVRQNSGSTFWYVCANPDCDATKVKGNPQKFKAESWDGQVREVSPAGTGQGADKELIIEKLAKDMGNLGYCNYAACAQYLSQAFDSGRDSVKGEGR